jgi:hypothetical protein
MMDIDLTLYLASTLPLVGYDAVKAVQDRERQDHIAVLVGLIRTAQQVADLPDRAGIGLRHGASSPLASGATGGRYSDPSNLHGT